MDNGPNGELKKFDATQSGRSSIVSGTKYCRGLILVPEQILTLLHDTQPSLPLPKDAQFQGFGIQDEGVDSKMQFFYTSLLAPLEHCLEMKPALFFRTIVQLADGLIPLDSELDGIELSPLWTFIMLRVKSSHWPATTSDLLPLYHLRYYAGRIELTDPGEAMKGQRRIQVQ